MKLSNQNKNMKKLKCEISRNEYPARYVVAGPILNTSFQSRKLENILNLPDTNDPSNICLVKYDESDD